MACFTNLFMFHYAQLDNIIQVGMMTCHQACGSNDEATLAPCKAQEWPAHRQARQAKT